MEWIIRLPILIILFIAIIIGIVDFLGLIRFKIKNKDESYDIIDLAEKYFKYFYMCRLLWSFFVVGSSTIRLIGFAIMGY